MQLKLTTPLTSILSRKGRGSKLSRENESPFSERDGRGVDSEIPSHPVESLWVERLAGEGGVRGISDCMDPPHGVVSSVILSLAAGEGTSSSR